MSLPKASSSTMIGVPQVMPGICKSRLSALPSVSDSDRGASTSPLSLLRHGTHCAVKSPHLPVHDVCTSGLPNEPVDETEDEKEGKRTLPLKQGERRLGEVAEVAIESADPPESDVKDKGCGGGRRRYVRGDRLSPTASLADHMRSLKTARGVALGETIRVDGEAGAGTNASSG